MFLSFIIPAYNEEAELGPSLTSIIQAARPLGQPFEVIVVNDASTDRTAEIAREAGARVIDVHLRQISAVRNAGAHAAKGDVFIFVDADTRLPGPTLQAAIHALNAGAAGGGAWVQFGGPVPWLFRWTTPLFNFFYMRVCRWAAGCFIFARREAFEAVGGFDETVYATEEIGLSRALKRRGPFILVKESVITSGRKAHRYASWGTVRLFFRFLFRGKAGFRRREGLDLWYDGRRENRNR